MIYTFIGSKSYANTEKDVLYKFTNRLISLSASIVILSSSLGPAKRMAEWAILRCNTKVGQKSVKTIPLHPPEKTNPVNEYGRPANASFLEISASLAAVTEFTTIVRCPLR